MARGKKISAEQIKELKSVYPAGDLDELASRWGITKRNLYSLAHIYGVRRLTPEELEQIKKEERLKAYQNKKDRIRKIVDTYDDQALKALAYMVTKEQAKDYMALLREFDGSETMNEEIKDIESWFHESAFCMMNGQYLIDSCRKAVDGDN